MRALKLEGKVRPPFADSVWTAKASMGSRFQAPAYPFPDTTKAPCVPEASPLADRAPENHRPRAGLQQLRPIQPARAAGRA